MIAIAISRFLLLSFSLITTAANGHEQSLQSVEPQLTPQQHEDLKKAIEADDVSQVDELLEKYFDKRVDIANPNDGLKPLHIAAIFGSKKTAEYLVLKGASFVDRVITPGSEQPLHLAAFHGRLEIVDFLLKTGPQLMPNSNASTLTEAEAANGETPLFYACKSKHAEAASIVKHLLEYGADSFRYDANGNQPIHRAVMARNFDIVKIIVGHDKEASEAKTAPSNGGKTISHLAAEFDLADFLKTGYFNPASLDRLGQTPFCTAGIHGSLEFAKTFNVSQLNTGKCAYNDQKRSSGLPFQIAARCRQKAYLEIMLREKEDHGGVNVLQQDSTGGTVVHAMVSSIGNTSRDDHAIVDLLWHRNKRIVEAADFLGRTPFLVAAAESSREFAEMLRHHFGANVLAVDRRGYSALHLAKDVMFADYLLSLPQPLVDIDRPTFPSTAPGIGSLTGRASPLIVATAEKKSIDLINFLISRNANKSATNENGQTAVHVAIEVSNIEAIDSFLANGFDFSIRDSAGRTPLLFAMELGQIDVAKMILNSKIGDVVATGDASSETKDTPLHLMARNNVLALAEILVKKKSSVNLASPNMLGQTPLHEAVANQHVEMVRLLVKAGAAIDAVDNLGRTPLHLTVPCTPVSQQIAHELLSSSQQVSSILDMTNDFGHSLLHVATMHNCANLLIYYLSFKNVSCSKLNRDGLSPLHLAKKLGHHKLLQLMLRSGKCSETQLDNCGNIYSKIDVRTPRTCGQLPEIENGVIVEFLNSSATSSSYCVNSGKALIRCDIGYHVVGSNVVKCGLNGRWQLKGYCSVVSDCEDILRSHPNAVAGVYKVTPKGESDQPIEVYCDMKSFGGGWTVFQRRVDSKQDFYLNWTSYKNGFGDLNANFWLGNDNIHRLTVYQRYSLLVSLSSWDDSQVGIAYYDNFFIEDEAGSYRLRFNKFVCGNFNNGQDGLSHHNGMGFTTRDRDNDQSTTNCAQLYTGAWWYRSELFY